MTAHADSCLQPEEMRWPHEEGATAPRPPATLLTTRHARPPQSQHCHTATARHGETAQGRPPHPTPPRATARRPPAWRALASAP
eukprot:4618720-Prymnesium_polylepis.1